MTNTIYASYTRNAIASVESWKNQPDRAGSIVACLGFKASLIALTITGVIETVAAFIFETSRFLLTCKRETPCYLWTSTSYDAIGYAVTSLGFSCIGNEETQAQKT